LTEGKRQEKERKKKKTQQTNKPTNKEIQIQKRRINEDQGNEEKHVEDLRSKEVTNKKKLKKNPTKTAISTVDCIISVLCNKINMTFECFQFYHCSRSCT